MLSRDMTVTKLGGSRIKYLLLSAAWACRRLARYIPFVPSRTVVLPQAAEAECAKLGGLPVRL